MESNGIQKPLNVIALILFIGMVQYVCTVSMEKFGIRKVELAIANWELNGMDNFVL